jgi:hypothetical protein
MKNSVLFEVKKIGSSVLAASILVGSLLNPLSSEAGDLGVTSLQTSSAKTVAASEYELDYAHSPMPNLKVTVSQTKDLTSQGIEVAWTGANPDSTRPSGSGGSNFMQIFQCWGEDPNRPGHPDRTTCQYGAYLGPGTARAYTTEPDKIDSQDMKYTKPGEGWATPPYTSIPFQAATGEQVWDLKRNANGGLDVDSSVSMYSNQFFSKLTSNEITWVGSDANGDGSAAFEVQTAAESPGLGCGSSSKINGKYVGQPCWLVVLPRGTSDNRQSGISQSGLFWDAWKHHIAIKLDFRPIGVRCQIGVPERQIQGSELAGAAFASWQPDLCGGSVKSAFVISNQFDGDALDAASSDSTSPLAITTRANNLQSNDPLVYAPLAIGGISVSFSVDRLVNEAMNIPPELRAVNLTPFTKMNLTPRLLAKLLTASYTEALPSGADISRVAGNPRNLTKDPEFLLANSDAVEWQYMDLKFGGIADVLMPNSRSYLAERLWSYILADPAAKDFMAGIPDEHGMKVNPWYSTDAAVNPSGSAFTLPNLGFPKSDPIEKPDNTTSGGLDQSGAVNLVTWRPYITDFENGALAALTGTSYELGTWDASKSPPGFSKTGRSPLGFRKVLALSTTPAAARFKTFQVALKNPAGQFVGPNLASLQAAQKAMTPSANNSGVYEFDFGSSKAKSAAEAYPLAVAIYAAINPTQQDAKTRLAYANLIRFAVTKGQKSGTDTGDLPPGYAPLNKSFVASALKVATSIQDGISPLEPSFGGGEELIPVPEVNENQELMIAAGDTPRDPSVPFSASTLPTVSALFICSLMFYTLIRSRKPFVQMR